ncbi:DWARF open reading frame isoform X1 [Mus caroli]|uniref:DWARF open reading frame isoform X1 n=1 Tax=Mus caroli TaxID=10089 RepID=A0A6P7QR94_MUSCR|nr:DWARF open reading frame isoform X1 [Mus caroli]XP_029330782.1 DWARF open reading frame isoform X1 [Mus caroli]
MAEKAESTSPHLMVPILLLVGWIVGCIIVIYIVFF